MNGPNGQNDPSGYEVTRAFYSFPNAERDWKTVITKLGKNSGNYRALETKLRRKLDDYESKNLVKHLVLKEDERYLPREPELEEKLRQKFNLRAAIVVDISALGRPKEHPGPESKQKWHDYEEKLHHQLGVWAGRLASTLLRPGDILGTGGGRGLYHTAMNVFPSTASRQCGDVVSLTGQIGADPHSPTDVNPHFIDADFIASLLHVKFELGGRPVTAGPIAVASKHSRVTNQVNVALIGIGAFGGQHRFKQFEYLDRLKPVSSLLRSINEIAEQMEKVSREEGLFFFHPVGDLCNWCFQVDPGDITKKIKSSAKLDRLIQQLNHKFLNTNPDHLVKISGRGSVIAVAGGPRKTGAIGHVLKRAKGSPWITHLVTDHELAYALIR